MRTGIFICIVALELYCVLPESLVNLNNATVSHVQRNALVTYFHGLSDDVAAIILQQALAAASVNRNLFDTEEPIGEDCQRIAKAVARMYEELALVLEVDAVIRRSGQTAVLLLKEGSFATANAAEPICRSIEAELKRYLVLYPEFEYQKKIARLSGIRGPPYYSGVPQSPAKVLEMFFRKVTDVEVARIVAIGVFVDCVRAGDSSAASYGAKAIVAMASRADLARPVQRLFSKIITEISERAIAETQTESCIRMSSKRFISYFSDLYRRQTMERLDHAFTGDLMLKNEYENARGKYFKRKV